MCRKILVLVLLLLTFVFPLTELANAVPPIPPTPSIYKGTVKDQNGNPVASGTIKAYTNDILRGSEEFTNGSYQRLVVSGEQNSINSIVKFKVIVRNKELGAVSATQIKWQPGKISGMGFGNVNLTVDLSSLPPILPGDVNQDGVVNIFDVQLAINITMEKITPTQLQLDSSDINNDGVVNIFDVVSIINIVMERE